MTVSIKRGRMNSPFLAGLLLGASLIIAIGAQNAFILRQGILRQHVFVLCGVCAVSDAVLIAVGVFGFASVIRQSSSLVAAVTIGGIAFLFVYGMLAFRRALLSRTMSRSHTKADTRAMAISTCLALTLLNPHVYLDTVVLVGSISLAYQGSERLAFGAGATIASFLWFFGLGYGARLLSGVFENPIAWRILDTLIGVVMWSIALSLSLDFLGP